MFMTKEWRGLVAVALSWFIGLGPILTNAHHNAAYGRETEPDKEAEFLEGSEPNLESDTSPELKAARQYLKSIQETGRHPLDEFRLMEQAVKPEKEVKVNWFQSGANALRNTISLDMFLSSSDGLSLRVESQSSQNLDWKNVGIRVLGEDGAVVSESLMRDYIDNAENHIDFNLANGATADRFVLTYRDRIIHRFAMEPKAIGFFKNYLVFYESENFVPEDGLANISFIDLERYASSLGQERLPVYRIPVKATGPNVTLSQTGDNLAVTTADGKSLELSAEVFAEFSKLQTVGFNLMSNLADKATYEDTAELAKQTHELFDSAVDLAGREIEEQKLAGHVARDDVLNTMTAIVGSRAVLGAIPHGDEKTQKALAAEYDNEIKKSGRLESILASLKGKRESQQKLLARVRAIVARITLPAPKGASESIYSGLVQSLGSLLGLVHEKGALKEGILQLLHKKKLYVSAAALGIAATYGDPTIGAFYQQSFEVASSIMWMMWGKAYSLGDLSFQAATTTLSGFNPFVLYDKYVSGQNFAHLSVGMTAAFAALATILGVPHLVANTVSLVKDLWNEGRPQKAEADHTWWAARWWGVARELISFDAIRSIPSLPRRFVERQDRRQLEYLKNLGESDVAAGEAVSEFTDEQEKEISKVISDLRAKQGGILKSLKGFAQNIGLFKKVEGEESAVASHRIQSFFSAFTHFLVSACSFTISGETYARMWNGWFMFRSMALRPVMTATFLYYPTYFKTIVDNQDGTTLPSVYNGGMRPFYKHEWLRLRQFFGDSQLAIIEEVEKTVGPFEDKVEAVALRQSLKALVAEFEEFSDLEKLVSKGKMPSVTSDVMESLSTAHRNFFQQHFMRLKDGMMTRVLKSLSKDKMSATDIHSASVDDMKYALAGSLDSFHQYDEAALTTLAVQVENEESLVAESRRYVASWWKSISNFTERHNLKIAEKLDPANNTQIERFSSVRRQLGNAQALARAVRATMASILVDKPLEIGFLLICLAGVDQGINKPLHDEMFSENAWFYLGRFPFLTGYLTNVITQTLADIWMKLQQDEQNEGSFGKRPDASFKGSSFRSWYLQKFFDKNNSWWKNQKHYIKIIWANMRAALVMYLASNMLTLGRLDLDMYITGYMMAYLLPLSGIAFKAEQAFELATGFFKKDIPEQYDSHPLTQKYLMDRTTSARIWFNFYYKTYENIMGFFLGNLQTIQTQILGTRSFVRWIFGGFTPTEIVANGLETLKPSVSSVPGAESALDGCQLLFTNNYTDGEKFIEGVDGIKK